MRIFLLTSSLKGGGAERVIATLANLCTRLGHEVVLATFLPPSSQDYSLDAAVDRLSLEIGIGPPTIVASARRNVSRARALIRMIRDTKPDVVVAFMTSPNIAAILAGRWTGVPVIVSERVDPMAYTPPVIWRVLRRLLYPLASCVVVQTSGVANGWAARFLKREQVAVLPNPLSFSVSTGPVPEASRDPVVLAAGRLDPQKGFDTLIQAFADLRAQYSGSSIELEIAGEGPERGRLQEQIEALGCAASVRLLGRVDDMQARLARARLFVLSSRFEGFPNVLLEALAAGTPVVATDCPSGPREILGDASPFPLVPVGSPPDMARAMLGVLNSAHYDQLSLSALDIANRYDGPTITRQWIDVFTSVTRAGQR